MDYKEKYENAVKAATLAKQDTESAVTIGVLEEIFPELRWSEDEMISKAIYTYLKNELTNTKQLTPRTNEFEAWLAWLEKQGVQKPTDKVEPKFKVGDFIVNDYCMGKVIELTNDAYLLDTGQGIPFSCEHNAHLWTIQDAKDGDVLATLNQILIFEKILPNNEGVSHCHYDFGCSTPQFNFNKDDNWYLGKEAKVYPATKEQRDLLFSKMKEAGYTFDFDKKELKKIEQKPAWSEKDAKLWLHDDDIFLDAAKVIVGDSPRRSYGGVHKKEIVPWLLSLKERLKAVKDRVQPQPKQEWSEEDEEHIKSLLERLEGMCKKGATFIRTGFAVSEDEDWLKHLKDRVLQPKQEWSEEDKRKIDRIYYILRQAADTHAFSTSCRLIGDKECIELQDFLKSITLHNTWKPSDEQMEELSGLLDEINFDGAILVSLYNDLKKLREE